jgi:hypothetical protein
VIAATYVCVGGLLPLHYGRSYGPELIPQDWLSDYRKL